MRKIKRKKKKHKQRKKRGEREGQKEKKEDKGPPTLALYYVDWIRFLFREEQVEKRMKNRKCKRKRNIITIAQYNNKGARNGIDIC